MAKVALSGGLILTGKVGNMVICQRNGKLYARRLVKPADPRTPDQVTQRGRFAQAVAAWRALAEPDKQRYRERARRMSRNGYQLFLAEELAG